MTEFIEQIFSSIFGSNVILATILISIVPIIEIKGAIPFAMSVEIWGSVALSSIQALLFSLIGSCFIVPILALIYIPIINALKRSKLFKKIAIKIENKVNKNKKRIEDRADKTLDDSLEKSNCELKANVSKANLQNDKTIINIKTEENLTENKEANNSIKDKEDINKDNALNEISNYKEESTYKINKNKIIYNKAFFIKLLSVFLFVCVPLPLTGVWTGTCVAVMLGLGFGWTCFSVILGNIVAGVLVTLVASIPGFDSIYIVYAVLVFVAVVLLISLIKGLINKKKNINK